MIFNTNQQSNHKGVLALILLAILGACTGLAAWISNIRGADATRGIAIVREIEEKKLTHFWPSGKGEVNYYLIRSGSKILGCKVVFRQPDSQGSFRGGDLEISKMSDGTSYRSISNWMLTADASQGKYASEIYTSEGNQTSLTASANIEQTDKKLSVTQKLHDTIFISKSHQPANYLPEGTLLLAIRLVAKQKTSAKFGAILDLLPPISSEPLFTTFAIEYAGEPESHPGGALVELRTNLPEEIHPLTTYTLNHHGQIVGKTYGDVEFVAVTKEELLKTLPQIAASVNALTSSAPETSPEEKEEKPAPAK